MTHELHRIRFNTKPRRDVQMAAPQRASLDGLEVRESSFGEWLEAGGERRSLQRADGQGEHRGQD